MILIVLWIFLVVISYFIMRLGTKIIEQDRKTKQINNRLIYAYVLESIIAGFFLNSIIYILSRGYYFMLVPFLGVVANFIMIFILFYFIRLVIKHLWKKRFGMADVFLLASTGALFGVVITISLYLFVSIGYIIINLFKKKKDRTIKINKEVAFSEYIIIPTFILLVITLFNLLLQIL